MRKPSGGRLVMFMRSVGALALIGTAVICAALPGGANGGRITSTNVTTIVHDYDSGGAQLLLRSDDYNGSGQATYVSETSGSSSLSSDIDSNGELNLGLSGQSLRTLWITPNQPVGSEPAAPPAGYYWQSVTLRSRCFDQNGNTVPLANIVTSSGNCKLGINFNSGGTVYKLLMSPFPFSAPGDGTPICPSTGCPATGVVAVTCNNVSSGQCDSWTIVPNTNAPNANEANLYSFAPKRGTNYWVYIGQYNNTFRIDVTSP
ncbi:MAG TPA: hypothetical protein VFI95_20840 [Terriglobales bacterium]|nr:hypothetical protein [Terriglobales bacterium]